MSDIYDAIFLGSGHNTLVLQAYLARAGLSTICLERNSVAGGGLTTVENPRLPGFQHNTHSFFHRAITAMPWYHDLELKRHGVAYIEPEMNVAMILRDGAAIEWWTDMEKTAQSFEAFSKKDADTLRRFVEEFRPIVDEIVTPEAMAPPIDPAKRKAKLWQSERGKRLLEMQALSPLEFVTTYFEHSAIRAGLLFFNGLREVDLRLPGFGHAIPCVLAGRHLAQMCIGGSAALAKGLVRDIEEHGGEVRCDVQIESITVERGRANGVLLKDGTQLTAKSLVASGLNPQQTFVKLMHEEDVPFDLRDKATRFEYNLIAPLFGLNVALNEPPQYTAAADQPELKKPFMVILGLDEVETYNQIVASHKAGEIVPSTVMWGACPTQFDPTQAPDGKHVAFMWEKLPYALDGDAANWDKARDQHGQQMLEHWADYAPNMAGDNVLDWFARSPLDTERTLPNMRKGDLLVGSFANNQVGFNRPFAGAGQYRTQLKGLYLCGGSTHPGGNITGLCGYNAMQVVKADLGLSKS